MKTRVLYVSATASLGGAETFLAQAAELHSGHVEPQFALFREGPLADKLRRSGKKVHLAPAAPRLRNPLSFWRTSSWLCKLVREENIDLLHSTMAYAALFGAATKWRCGVPHVWFQHGPVGSWQDWLAGRLPHDLVLVNSRYTSQAQLRLAPKSRVLLCPLGVDSRSPPALLPGDEAVFTSAMICRPQPQKGIELWLKANALLMEQGVPVRCLLIGAKPEGAYETALVGFAQAWNVPLELCPASQDPWAAAGEAQALVCASISPEGFGLVLAEGMQRGVAVVAPREGGPLDFIRDGENGIFFEPRSARSLADALARLARDPALVKKLRASGPVFAKENLSAPGAFRRIETAYESIRRT